MTRRIIGYHPITSILLRRYVIIENKKIKTHKRKLGKREQIPEVSEIKCYLCSKAIVSGINVTVLTTNSRVKMYHQNCALARNVEPEPSDIKYPLDKRKKSTLIIVGQKDKGIEIY